VLDGPSKLCQDFLNMLEQKETRLLSWGFVDGGFSDDEIVDLASEVVNRAGSQFSEIELIELMQHKGLLFTFNQGGRNIWRTRMAEAVRLFVRLKQLFPGKAWQLAPNLVSDYRFVLKPRVYPARNITLEEVVRRLESTNISSLGKKVVESVLTSNQGQVTKLSEFQLRAAETMLNDIKTKQTRGMVISAGTGTGKTLAFYLPALVHLAALTKPNDYWTKILAIYPRNELLKDQFSEILKLTRKLGPVMMENGNRKLRIGVFFGPTPNSSMTNDFKDKWESQKNGFLCPYLLCPECGGKLIWRKSDVELSRERLFCTGAKCNFSIGDDEIILTRQRMAECPPDILFTTTESLNRQMSDSEYGPVFGIGVKNPPHIVLLDEIHTYTGIHGAHVAHLIRRWRHASGARAHFTGLSATLRDARDFMGQLVGLNTSQIEEIYPVDYPIQEGMEYLLVLRGDPVSGSSLLSTTIQTAMLLGRVMNPRTQPVSEFYGSKVFVFTDDLDVTNRLYHDLTDAEGLHGSRGAGHNHQPLAAIRSKHRPNNQQRFIDGQSWMLCEDIGHPPGLTTPLMIGRTSSQDVGVDPKCDLIVTTASLEVGFDDPAVGAIIQHKAPLDMAAYVQRKGRAGRPVNMRPWTVVVLSDYGRDRIAFQGYERLMDAELERKTLPISSGYILRMQAVYAFMDWLFSGMRGKTPPGSVWNDFSGRPQDLYRSADRQNSVWLRQQYEATVIREILENDDQQQALKDYLMRALDLSDDQVQRIMWDQPRPLMTGFLPTILRRLESQWAKHYGVKSEPGGEYKTPFAPAPDYVPANLFSDLNLPEVEIAVNAGTDNEKRYPMPIIQALKTFAPGNVTKRFGIRSARDAFWISPPSLEDNRDQVLAIEDFCVQYEPMGVYQMMDMNGAIDIPCFRPWVLAPVRPPSTNRQKVLDTSKANLIWHTQFVPSSEGLTLDMPQGSVWGNLIKEISFHCHQFSSPLQVRRFATGSRTDIRIKEHQEVRNLEATIRFLTIQSGDSVGLGFSQEVDGICFRYRIPDDFFLDPDDENQAKIRSFRSAFFRHKVLTSRNFDGIANYFQRDWLYQLFMSALVTRAMLEQIDLSQAAKQISRENVADIMAEVMECVFQTLEGVAQQDESQGEDEENQVVRQKVHEELLELCHDKRVTDELINLSSVLWQHPGDEWDNWARERLKCTIGSALLQACLNLSSEFGSGDLRLDIDPGPRPIDAPQIPDGLAEIWITETTSGGGGIVEEIMRQYAEDPRRFFRLVDSCLFPSDYETVDIELTRLVKKLQNDSAVVDCFAQVRNAQNYETLHTATINLRKVLIDRGFLVTHSVLSAVNNRLLRPGSTKETDRLIYDLVSWLESEEKRLGIEIDARVFAYVCSQNDYFSKQLAHLDYSQEDDPNWRFQVIFSLLWPRGNIARSLAFANYNPFVSIETPDREILLDILPRSLETVPLTDPDWKQKINAALGRNGTVRLFAELSSEKELKSALLELEMEPLDIGYLHLYPLTEGLVRESDGYYVELNIREAVQ